MNWKKMRKNQKGFTLIEIIAVIIIMGILAAVAVPKFYSMQEDAKHASLNGALSEAAARFNHAYGRYILDKQKAPADISVMATGDYLGTAAATGEDIGDFTVKYTKNATSGDLEIEVVSADTFEVTAVTDQTKLKKTITGINCGS